ARRSNGPRREPTPTVRAHVVQDPLDAVRAERALVGTDARGSRLRRQIPAAILTVRTHLQCHVSRPDSFDGASFPGLDLAYMPKTPRTAALGKISPGLLGTIGPCG